MGQGSLRNASYEVRGAVPPPSLKSRFIYRPVEADRLLDGPKGGALPRWVFQGLDALDDHLGHRREFRLPLHLLACHQLKNIDGSLQPKLDSNP